jgi:hypothetical protein
MNRALYTVLLLFGFVSISYSQGSSSNVLIGILEDDRLELINWKKGPSQNRVIRPLFEKKGDEWKLSTNHPEEIQWTIAFDGKNVGIVKSRPNTNKDPFNTKTHVPMPQPGQSLILGKASEDFSGWQNTLFNRPLVVVSRGSYKDPDEWKPVQPTKDQTQLFKSTFRNEYPKVQNCNEKEEPLHHPWPYKDSEINITKTYHSNKGDLLVGMFLEGGKCGINDGPFQLQLFLFRADQSSSHLTSDNRKYRLHEHGKHDLLSLILVDAGDYDGDGKSEVIFFVTGYNEDGYAMFYDLFQKNVMCTWSYH